MGDDLSSTYCYRLELAALLVVIFMFVCHVWMNYAWWTSVAYLAKKETNVMGLKWYRQMMALFGANFIYFGFTFLIGALVY